MFQMQVVAFLPRVSGGGLRIYGRFLFGRPSMLENGMNEVIKTILERRTIRKYQERQIGREELDLILEAGLCLGGNNDEHCGVVVGHRQLLCEPCRRNFCN